MANDPNQTTKPDAIWTGNVNLYWVSNELRAGSIHVGSTNFLPDPKRHPNLVWRAWVMNDEDGRCVGWFRTEKMAKDALEGAAIQELLK